MRMKNEDENIGKILKTIRKNRLYFYSVTLGCPSLMSDLIATSNLFSPKELNINIPHRPDKITCIEKLDLRAEAFDLFEYFLDAMIAERRSEFLATIDHLLAKYHSFFGREWQETFMILTLMGYLCPPKFNLHIATEKIGLPYQSFGVSNSAIAQKILERTGGKRIKRYGVRVIMHLNPDTSTQDIKLAMTEAKRRKGIAWPNFQSFNLTPNKATQILEALNVEAQRHGISDGERKYGRKSYQDYVADSKQFSDKAWEGAVLKNRRGKKEDQKQKRPAKRYVKKRHAATLLSIAKKKGLTDKQAKKEANSMSQRIKRLKPRV